MSKIYTKTGDSGDTSLLDGKRVPKYHPRVEAYGTVDELNSFIGLLRSHLDEKQKDTDELLRDIQKHLYYIGSLVACDSCKQQNTLPQITNDDITFLEQQMDIITNQLPELTAFIIPCGSKAASFCHVCRSVCRRAERNVIQVAQKTYIDELIIIYLNRLSDFLFTLARKLNHDADFGDIKYK